MQVLPYQWTQIISLMVLVLHFSDLLASTSAAFAAKVDEEVPDPSIKCGECPCVNPCGQLPLAPALDPPPRPPPPPAIPPPPPPPPLPPMQYCPPRFVSVARSTPPPPPRFIYVTAQPGNLYQADPFNLQIYSNAAKDPLVNIVVFLLLGCSALQFLAFW